MQTTQMAYEWMIKATPQREWIEKKGIFLMLAFFLSEIGAGIYFLSMLINNQGGMIFGWILTLVLGGGVHMYYLGNPFRFWRIFLKPRTSELSRGVWAILFFAILGFGQIVNCSFCNSIYVKILMGIICVLLIMHGFATMNTMRSLPSWNSSVTLPLSVFSGLWVGYQIVEIILSQSSIKLSVDPSTWALALLSAYVLCLITYLWGTTHSSDVAKLSIRQMLTGEDSKIFYLFVIGAGIVVPLIITMIMNQGNVDSTMLLIIRLIAVFAGDLALRYTVMKNAYYTPLI